MENQCPYIWNVSNVDTMWLRAEDYVAAVFMQKWDRWNNGNSPILMFFDRADLFHSHYILIYHIVCFNTLEYPSFLMSDEEKRWQYSGNNLCFH
jgi:hypothetical protein